MRRYKNPSPQRTCKPYRHFSISVKEWGKKRVAQSRNPVLPPFYEEQKSTTERGFFEGRYFSPSFIGRVRLNCPSP